MGRASKRLKPPFALNIISRRNALGWNAHKLAEMAKVPYPTLRDIEAGINAGREETKALIAKALECSIGDLYGGSSERPIRPTPQALKQLIEGPDSALHSTVSSVLEELLRVAPEIRAAVLAVLYDDESIARPYLDKTSAKSKAR